jgi:hypothetical protein
VISILFPTSSPADFAAAKNANGATATFSVLSGTWFVIESSEPWISATPSFYEGRSTVVPVSVIIAANTTAVSRTAMFRLYQTDSAGNKQSAEPAATLTVNQSAGMGGAPAGSPPTSKSYIDQALLGRVLPFISNGAFVDNAPFVLLYDDSLRASYSAAAPALTTANSVYMQALEPTPADLREDQDTGFLLPRTFKALLSRVTGGSSGLAPAAFIAPGANGGSGKTRLKVVSAVQWSVTGPAGDQTLDYAVAECAQLTNSEDYMPNWSDAAAAFVVPASTSRDPATLVRAAVFKALLPLEILSGDSATRIVDLQSPAEAFQCGTTSIGVRGATVELQKSPSINSSWPWSFGGTSTWQSSQAMQAKVTVPVTVLCGCGKPMTASSPDIASYVSRKVLAVSRALSDKGRHEFVKVAASSGQFAYCGWLSMSVEANAEPAQVPGRPDLFWASAVVTAVVPVLTGDGG